MKPLLLLLWRKNRILQQKQFVWNSIWKQWYWNQSQYNVNNNKGDLLVLSSTFTSPESDASAAGVRTEAIIHYFQSNNSLFENVWYGTGRNPSKDHPHYYFPLNQEERIKDLLVHNKTFANVKAVIFDRYYTEEAYSFYFYKYRPDIVRILDMQDIHSLRQMRQDIIHQYDKTHDITNTPTENIRHPRMTKSLMKQLMTVIPEIQQQTTEEDSFRFTKQKTYDKFIRELTAIHRSDVTMVCSPTEMRLLQKQLQIPSHKLVLAPFFVSPQSTTTTTTTNQDQKKDIEFVMLGGFLHEPNVDSVQYVNYELWPRIYKQIQNENPSIHIYGAHLSNKLKHRILHQNRNKNFYLHGKADTLDQVFGSANDNNKNQTKKILLAPLRFGAGIKGKIIEAWKHNCPVITTPIGAEGMTRHDSISSSNLQSSNEQNHNHNIDWSNNYNDWGGLIASDTDSFIDCAVKLYQDEELWYKCRDNGHYLLQSLYNDKYHFDAIQRTIEEAMQNTMNRRKFDYTYGMLWHQTFRSTEYFSKWIETKEKNHTNKSDDDHTTNLP